MQSKDFFLSQEAFSIDQCATCGFKFTNPRPIENESAKYYESLEYLSHGTADRGFIGKIYSFIRNYTISRKVRLITNFYKTGHVLDVGCGTGNFLNALSKKNFKVTGIEPNEVARTQATVNYKLDVADSFDHLIPALHFYDAITMWHVLEHIYKLDSTLAAVKKSLQQDGLLIIALPNPDSKDALLYSKYWAAYDLPRHLYHFSPLVFTSYMEKEGFHLMQIKPMFFDSFYISLLSEKYKHGKSNYAKAFLNGLYSNFSAFFGNGNYSSLIYIFSLKK